MVECISLINLACLCIEYFWISCINNILYNMCTFIHSSFIPIPLLLFFFILPSFFSIFPHHIFLADQIKAFSHPCHLLLFKPFKPFQLDELNILQGTPWRFLFYRDYCFWKHWLGRDKIYSFAHIADDL